MNHHINNESQQASDSSQPARLLKEYLEERLRKALEAMNRHIWKDEEEGLGKAYERVRRLFHLRRALKGLSQSIRRDKKRPLYLVSAPFLREAFNTLTKTADENLVCVTGPENGGNVFALTRLVTFELAQKSAVCASPDPSSELDALMRLDEDGLRLLATFHSHPGQGAGATHPSGVDLATQQRLEKAGYPAIGTIFSRGGFIRFYTKDRPFQLAVSGSGCEQMEENVYRLKGAKAKSSFLRRLS